MGSLPSGLRGELAGWRGKIVEFEYWEWAVDGDKSGEWQIVNECRLENWIWLVESHTEFSTE